MKRRASIAIALAACSALYACSLFIPFDDYPGPPVTDAAPDADASTDHDADDGDATDAACDVDTKADPANCGACGRVCVGGGACDAGRCPIEEVFADPALGKVDYIALGDAGSASYVYFTSTDAGVGRAIVGATTYELAPLARATSPGAVSIDDQGGRGAIVHDDVIELFDLDTFASVIPKAQVTGRVGVGPLIVRGQRMYWGETAGMFSAKTGNGADAGVVGPADAGQPIAFDDLSDIQWLGSDKIIWRNAAIVPERVTDPIDGVEGSVDFIQANAKTYFSVKVSPTFVVRIDLSNTGPPTTSTLGNSGLDDPRRVVASATNVYVLDKGGTRLRRMDWSGRALITLADRLTASHALALDDAWVYLADGPRVVRTSK